MKERKINKGDRLEAAGKLRQYGPYTVEKRAMDRFAENGGESHEEHDESRPAG